MRIEDNTYYCNNTHGETVGIPLTEISLVGRYFNEKLLNSLKADKWTFDFQISKKLAKALCLCYWAECVNHPSVVLRAVPAKTEEEVANVWNEINYFHNNKRRTDAIPRGTAMEYLV